VTRFAGWGVIGVVALAVVWLASHREGDIARSIAEFLVTAEFKYLRRCANTDSCTLVFYDATNNHRRQWRSNSMCGATKWPSSGAGNAPVVVSKGSERAWDPSTLGELSIDGQSLQVTSPRCWHRPRSLFER
jgi:CGNR zinc finger